MEVMPQPINDEIDSNSNDVLAHDSSQQEMTREQEIQSIIDTLTEEIAQT